jgi:hypothetical protein
MKIGLVAIAKDENAHLKEWIDHHINAGFDHVIIYDNNSVKPIRKRKNTTVIKWTDTDFKSQSRAYLDACKRFADYDYLAFFDIDEFVMGDFRSLLKWLNYPQGLGLYWRIYGHPTPPETRKPATWYNYYHPNNHIKSILDPKSVIDFPDPHKATINGLYLDENGSKIFAPIQSHTSNKCWIKHIFTRSRSEFANKIKRGDANLRVQNRTWEDFDFYNSQCTIKG